MNTKTYLGTDEYNLGTSELVGTSRAAVLEFSRVYHRIHSSPWGKHEGP